MQEPDPSTIASAAAGDLDSFAEIVRITQPDLWRFLRHLVGDPQLAEDLTQDTYMAVYRSLGTFRGDSLFRTWLLRIARNLALDEHRRAARRVPVADLEQHPEPRSAEAGPATSAEITAAVESLSEPQRSAFVLVEVFGLRYREVAQIISIPEGTVKSRVYHARVQLVGWFTAADGGADEEEQGHG